MRHATLLALILLAVALPATTGRAQVAAACFAETGYCIGGRTRRFWERSGGLAVLGLPITPVQEELVEGRPRWVQWFERARIELHPENAPPYDVQLGRLGADAAARPGRDYYHPAGACRAFAETGQTVCGEFLAAWRSHGLSLDDDPAPSEAESLALFGLPIGGPRAEAGADGRERLVQWFERARFEYHPEHGWPHRVLFGLIGAERAPRPVAPPGDPAALTEPPPPPLPPPPPGYPVAGAAPNQPVRLLIEAIGLDRPLLPVGHDGSGALIVPDHDVGWYEASARPGEGDNIVLWGHVLPFMAAPHLPAPFADLQRAPVGARMVLYDGAGDAHSYTISAQIWALPDEVAYIFPQGREMLTLVSCIGEDVYAAGGVVDKSHRLITVAELAEQ
jgi:hypothetical protein